MLVTDRGVLLTYPKAPADIVLKLLFSDAVAYLGSEGEEGFIFEADDVEPKLGHTTIALFRLDDRASAIEILRFIERSIPPAARNLMPNLGSNGSARTLPVGMRKTSTAWNYDRRALDSGASL